MRATQVFFLAALLFSQVLCDTYYVSPNGDDSGEGKADSPFQTFAQAFNSTDGSAALEIYVYPGTYGGVNNTGLTYAGPLTINYFQNATLEEGDSSLVQIDCTSAQGGPCLTSGTSITIAGLDEAGIAQIFFDDCGTCITVNKTSEEKSASYLVDITGVTFNEVTQYAIFADNIYSATVANSSFTDNDAAGLTLVSLSNVDNQILIHDNYFSSTNQNAIFLFNVSTAELHRNIYENAFFFAQGVDTLSQVLIEDSTFTCNANIVASTYAVTLNTGTFTIENSKFETVGISALKSSSSHTTSLINSTFSMTDGINGGATYFENVETVTVSENCFFSQNVASGFGGAIYLVNSTIHLAEANFTLNVAVDGSSIGCAGNESVYYDNTTVFFYDNINTGVNATDIQGSCFIAIQTLRSSLVVSTIEGGSDAWIWILVSIAIVFVFMIILAGAIFIIYQRKRQSYTRMD